MNRHRIKYWGDKAFWSILDQAFFSGTSFLQNILLARWLMPEQYGAYVLAFSFLLILSIFHNSIITEPMIVYGSGKYKDSISTYFGVLIRLHYRFSGIIFVVILSIVGLIQLRGGSEFSSALLGLSFSATFILALWLIRRVFYILYKPKIAALGGFAYGIVSLLALYFFHHSYVLSPFWAYIIIGLSSFLIFVFFCLFIPNKSANECTINIKNTCVEHWRYGRWALAAALLAWIPQNLIYFMLSYWGSLADSGAFRAIMNFEMPILHLYSVVMLLALPRFVSIASTYNYKRLNFNIIILAMVLALLALLYSLFLFWLGEPIFLKVYHGNYANSAYLASILSIFLIFASFTSVFSSAFRALQAPHKIFQITALSTSISLVVSIFLVYRFQILGATVAVIVSAFVEASIMILLYNSAYV